MKCTKLNVASMSYPCKAQGLFWKRDTKIQRSKVVEDCSEVMSCSLDKVVAHMNLQWLWLHTKVFHIIKRAKILAWIGKGFMKAHPYRRKKLTAIDLPRGGGVCLLKSHPLIGCFSIRWPYTSSNNSITKWTHWFTK